MNDLRTPSVEVTAEAAGLLRRLRDGGNTVLVVEHCARRTAR